MSQHLSRWTYLSQVIVQRATLVSMLSLAVAGAVWSLAAAVGFAPWLRLDVQLGRADPVGPVSDDGRRDELPAQRQAGQVGGPLPAEEGPIRKVPERDLAAARLSFSRR